MPLDGGERTAVQIILEARLDHFMQPDIFVKQQEGNRRADLCACPDYGTLAAVAAEMFRPPCEGTFMVPLALATLAGAASAVEVCAISMNARWAALGA
jgi:hypothetical protein